MTMFAWTTALLLVLTLALTESTDPRDSYTFFELVRQWSPNMCYQASHACKHLPPTIDTWTIHGLWPTLNSTSYPSNCAGDQCHFDSNNIADLADELHVKWPSDYKGQDTKFWTHEFCKHGTCATDVLCTQHAYFAKALTLHNELDVEAALGAVGIIPDWNQTYSMNRLEDAIRKWFGVDEATYWCRFVRDNGETKQLLYQVSLCLDKKFRVRNCPVMPRHSCDEEKEFYLLPFDVFNTFGRS